MKQITCKKEQRVVGVPLTAMLVLLRTAKLCHLCLSLLKPPALAMYSVPAAVAQPRRPT